MSSYPTRPSREAWRLLGGLAVIASLAAACTLTQDDFEPNDVSTLGSEPSGAAPGTGGTVTLSCGSGESCCTGAADCAAGEACQGGTCVSACSGAEDLSTCPVALCPGPGCPEAPSCSDGVQNGMEPAIDCGESCPERCPASSPCHGDGDCISLHCDGGTCAAATCDDGLLNGSETALDCGGDCPTGCAEGAACAVDGDCAAGLFCAPATGLCTDASCQDGVQGGDEILPDCGGGVCPGCAAGTPCNAASDCESGVCSGGQCGAASCSDGRVSGDESGVDCGGEDAGCPRCPDGEACASGADCESGACEDGACVSCADGLRNGTEADVDCGGGDPACPRCPGSARCSGDDDCGAGLACIGGICQAPRCDDGLLNGTEADVDCGGSDPECPRCQDGARCNADADCAALSCENFECISCTDGVRNGSESDVDCGGGAACDRCQAGATCRVDADCASGACADGICCGGTRGDCTRCAERLSPNVDCAVPTTGVDPTGVLNCTAFLACLADNAERCPTRNTPGCSGDDQANDACPHNDYGGNAGTGITRANQVLQNAGCEL